MKFNDVGDSEGVYMSNGGHSSSSHGVAMTYKLGQLEFVFRTKSGLYWNVKYDNALEDKWYHVMVTWTSDSGVKMYINGDLVSESKTSEKRYTNILMNFYIKQSFISLLLNFSFVLITKHNVLALTFNVVL